MLDRVISLVAKLSLLVMLAIAAPAAAAAAGNPIGTWIDQTGEGAVEIADCNGRLCGRVVWVKSAAHAQTCQLEIIGEVRAVAQGQWDGGWIYDPDSKRKYDVAITVVANDKLKVRGYLGNKMYGQTMVWTRATSDLKRCDRIEAAAVSERAVPVAPSPAAGPSPDTITAAVPETVAALTSMPLPLPAPAAEQVPVPSLPGNAVALAAAPLPAPAVAQTKTKLRRAVSTKKSETPERSHAVASRKSRAVDEDEVQVHVRLARGGCAVSISAVGTFKFPC